MRVIIDNAVNDSFAAWKCTQVASCRRHLGAASYSRKGEVAHEVAEQEKLGLEFLEFCYEFWKHLDILELTSRAARVGAQAWSG